MRCSFKKHKLHNDHEFLTLKKTGAYYKGEAMSLVYLVNDKNYPRLGLAISKRYYKSAVTRNLIKRRHRALFIENIDRLPSIDVVMFSKVPAKHLKTTGKDKIMYGLLKKDWQNFVSYLNKREAH